MKKIFKIIMIFLVVLMVFGFQVVINAQEGLPFEDEPSQLAQEFKEVWLPYILDFFTALTGTGVGLLIIKKIFDKSLNLLGLTKDKLEKANDVVSKSNLINQELKMLITEKINKVVEEVTYYQQQLIQAQEEIKDLKAELQKTNNDLKLSNQKILDVLKIAFLNNTDLVKNGYAIEIAKLLGDEDGK